MNDYYTETLITRTPTPAATLLPILSAALTVISAFSILLIGFLALVPFLLFCLITKYLFGIRHVEYEYLLADKQFSVDIIYNRQKRKKAANYSLEEIQVIAPESSDRIKEYDRQVKKTTDFSSGEQGKERYVLICQQKGICEKVIIEPDARMKSSFKMAAPRLFFER